MPLKALYDPEVRAALRVTRILFAWCCSGLLRGKFCLCCSAINQCCFKVDSLGFFKYCVTWSSVPARCSPVFQEAYELFLVDFVQAVSAHHGETFIQGKNKYVVLRFSLFYCAKMRLKRATSKKCVK